jgi:glycosyltransferase involved in cell wall biosynthesis
MMLSEPCLTVVVPCYDEASTVLELVKVVLESPWVNEVVIVDDGSTDGTRDLLATIDHDQVTVVLHENNQGKGAALRTGFSRATQPYVIIQDADLEYDPAEYSVLLEPLIDGRCDVVYGSRFVSNRPHRVLYFWHSVGNRFLTMLSNMTTNLNLTDMETCYKAFRIEVVKSLTLTEDRFGIEPELTARVAAGGWRVFEVGISYNGRSYDEGKKIGWRDGVSAIRCILKYAVVARRDVKRSTREG